MEFRFRAGDRRPQSPSPACDRAGPSHSHGEPPPLLPLPFEWEAAAWRQRIIRAEVERRLVEEACFIEEEVRRQLALARARFHGAIGLLPFVGPDGPLVPPPPPTGMFFGPDGSFLPPVPLPLMPPVGMQPNWPHPASFGEVEGIDRRVGVEQSILVKRRVQHQPKLKPNPKLKAKHKHKHKLELRETEPSENSEILSSETNISGVKRKADVISASTKPAELQNAISAATEPSELQNAISATTEPAELQNAAKRSCALCQVSATSKADLNKHFRGRRHLANLVHCRGIQVINDDKSGMKAITRSDNGAGPSNAPRKIRILVNGAIHEVEKRDFLTFAPTKATELPNEISVTTEAAELQNVTFATTEPTEQQNAARFWSCAVCQVRSTSKAKHKKHFIGKRHLKAELSLYDASIAASAAGPSDPPKKIHILVDGAMHEVVQQGDYVWCERCSIRCINAAAMTEHLRGKKHSLLNKVWRSIKAVRMKNRNKKKSCGNRGENY